MSSWVPGQCYENRLLEFCEYKRIEDPVGLISSSSGTSRRYQWRRGLVRIELSSNGTGRSKLWASNVMGEFTPLLQWVHTSSSVRGHQLTMGPAGCFTGVCCLSSHNSPAASRHQNLPDTGGYRWCCGHFILLLLLCFVPLSSLSLGTVHHCKGNILDYILAFLVSCYLLNQERLLCHTDNSYIQ